LNQIRFVDKQRLVNRLGVLDAATMKEVDAAMMISLGLTNV
jgi:mRNA-degrading endonuclease toxin of MazEF toxin-antitoxin module